MLIRQHDSSPLIWPNLTSIHYFHDEISWYEANNLAFVEKNHKSQNSPEFWPIERYWELLKCNIKTRFTAALYIKLFKQKVNRAIKTIDQKLVQTLMRGLMGKVRQFGRGEKFEQTHCLIWIIILPQKLIKYSEAFKSYSISKSSRFYGRQSLYFMKFWHLKIKPF
jgi:hypothetical protein